MFSPSDITPGTFEDSRGSPKDVWSPPISPPSSVSSPPSTASDGNASVIIGLACRVPGAENVETLWENLLNQRDLQKKMPADRFNVDAFYHPDGTNKGTTNARYGYFLDQDLGLFDPGFFNVSGKEAEAMDPQQRMLLEVVYEALEDAGLTMQDIDGSQASVFCGCFTNDYRDLVGKDDAYYPKYHVTGTGNSILSNRISYFYNLHGPSVTVDTACSSSLVCFHWGNQSLQSGESDLSIVVGSALHFDSVNFNTMTDLGMLSVDGRCRTFDAKGSGYARGEGICAAILKRQKDAEFDGNRMRAVVRASGVNHDGRKQGITLPSPESQEALIRKTYKIAGIELGDTHYFEAHGTGTAAGDPREARAIGSVFADSHKDRPLLVGSIKSNIGHLEGASGLAGIIKSTLVLESGQIPPNMHFDIPNPAIDFDAWKIQVPTRLTEWPVQTGPRRVSINSFGYGGTNAHVVLEDTVPRTQIPVPKIAVNAQLDFPASPEVAIDRPFLLPLYSHSERAGNNLKSALADYIEKHPKSDLRDIAQTLSARRTNQHLRSFVVATTLKEINGDLTTDQSKQKWTSANEAQPRLGFVFTGQGGQWFAMGRQLIEKSSFFKKTIVQCDVILQSLPDRPEWSVLHELLRSKETSRLAETRFSQPICTALQLALVDLLSCWGIIPSAVVGHSSGEIAAAYAADVLSFRNAVIAAYYRGLYMASASQDEAADQGKMMAVGLNESDGENELEPYSGRLCIAAINSPSSITVSGDEDAIMELKASLDQRSIFARLLQVTQAFHSHHMLPLAPAYLKALEGCEGFTATSARCRMFSSVTARIADPGKMGPTYWSANMTGAVRFADALTGIILDEDESQNVDALVEIGPHPALKAPSRQVTENLRLDLPYIASLSRGLPGFETLLTMAGSLFALGYPVDLRSVNSDLSIDSDRSVRQSQPSSLLRDLPTHAWDHQRYWCETRFTRQSRQRDHRHSMLGSLMAGSVEGQPRWRNYFRQRELPWLLDHQINGKVIFPAAGYLSMAIEALARTVARGLPLKSMALQDVFIKSALVVDDSERGAEVITEIRPVSDQGDFVSGRWYEFTIHSYDEAEMCVENCRGTICAQIGPAASLERPISHIKFSELEEKTNRRIPHSRFYRNLSQLGLQYGPSFQLLSGNIESGPGFAIAPLKFSLNDLASESERTMLSPSLFDTSIHTIFAAIESILSRPLHEPFIPTFISSMSLSGLFGADPPILVDDTFQVRSHAKLLGPRVAVGDVFLETRQNGTIVMSIQGLELTSLGEDTREGKERSLFFRQRWEPSFDLLTNGNEDILQKRNLSDLVNIYSHQHPNAKILYLGDEPDQARSILCYLGGRNGERRRFQNLTPCSRLGETTSTYTALREDWGERILETVSDKCRYDLVIVDETVDTAVSSLLAGNGVVISDRHDFETEGLVHAFDCGHHAVWRKAHAVEQKPQSLTVCASSKPSESTKQIISSIRDALAGNVTTVELSDISETHLSHDIVVLTSLDEDILSGRDFEEESVFEAVKKLLTNASGKIVWALKGASIECSNPSQAMINGLARVARSEEDQLRLVTVDFSQNATSETMSKSIIEALKSSFTEDEIAEREGIMYIPRVEADDSLNSKLRNGYGGRPTLSSIEQLDDFELQIAQYGHLESFYFAARRRSRSEPLEDDELEVEVKASTISTRDVSIATGAVSNHAFGEECSGVVTKVGANAVHSFEIGDHVVVLRPTQGTHKKFVRPRAALSQRIGGMSFSAAAVTPIALMTAYHSLVQVARLTKGESILIHSGASDVGQMAIQIAQMLEVRVLATESSTDKRSFLKKKYGLKNEEVFSSRNENLAKTILEATNLIGVDVVLNDLTGNMLRASWDCVAFHGRFVDISQGDKQTAAKFAIKSFEKNVTYAPVSMRSIFEHQISLTALIFKDSWELVKSGNILTFEKIDEFSLADIANGFRSVQSRRGVGSTVLVSKPGDHISVAPLKYMDVELFTSDKTYLIIGGLGGLGRNLAEWMVRKGAKRLAFLSRSGANSPEAAATLEWLKKRNIAASAFRGDVANQEQVQECIHALGSGLSGIFHAAMVLQDSQLKTMTYAQWEKTLIPKVRGGFNLHRATLEIPLDFFICLSSVSSIIGAKGQANYAAGNCYLDALMRRRREEGLAGTTLNIGMVVGIGAVSEDTGLQRTMERQGYDPVSEEELFYQIEEAVASSNGIATSCHGVEQHQIMTGLTLGRKDLYWASKPLLRNLYENDDFGADAVRSNGDENLYNALQNAKDSEHRVSILLHAFMDKIASALAISLDYIQPSNRLSAYGLDSIVATDFRKWFNQAAGADVPLFDILSAQSIHSLVTGAAGTISVEARTSHQDHVKERADEIQKEPKGMNDTEFSSMGQIIKLSTSDPVPMSPYQSRLWHLYTAVDDQAVMHLTSTARLQGNVNVEVFKNALSQLVSQNESLHTAFFEEQGFPKQQIQAKSEVDLQVEDFSAVSDPEKALSDYTSQKKQQKLNVERGEVCNFALLRLDENEQALVAIFHAICIDHASLNSLFTQLMHSYDASKIGTLNAITSRTNISYIDFTMWQILRLESAAVSADVEFWRECLLDVPNTSNLLPSAISARPQQLDFARKTHSALLSKSSLARMKRICSQADASALQFLLASFRAFIFRHTKERDLVILIADGNRPHPEVDGVVGLFANTVPIRCVDDCDTSFEALLKTMRHRTLSAMRHTATPFAKILDIIDAPKPSGHHPLEQLSVDYHVKHIRPEYKTQDFAVSDLKVDKLASSCEISLEAFEDVDGGLDIRLEHSSTLYDEEDMARFLDDYKNFLTSTIRDHRQQIQEIPSGMGVQRSNADGTQVTQ